MDTLRPLPNYPARRLPVNLRHQPSDGSLTLDQTQSPHSCSNTHSSHTASKHCPHTVTTVTSSSQSTHFMLVLRTMVSLEPL